MSDKFSANSPKQQFTDSIAFKKSPNKFIVYESANNPKQNKQPEIKSQNTLPTPNYKFQTIKKIPLEQSDLRQTMSYKSRDFEKFSKYQDEKEKSNKSINYLRQTLNSKSDFKNNFEKNLSGSYSTQEAYKMSDTSSYHSQTNKGHHFLGESKSSINLQYQKYDSRSDYKSNKAVDNFSSNNKKFQELKSTIVKSNQEDQKLKSRLLKKYSLQYNQTVEVDKQSEPDLKFNSSIFKKKKNQSNFDSYTPKIEKSSYEERFYQNKEPVSAKLASSRKSSIKISEEQPKKITKIKFSIQDFSCGKNLGEGKFGSVCLAKHKKTNCIVALKKIPKEMIKSHYMVDQIALELRLQSCLNHKNICTMYGFFADFTHLYIVLEYMEQGTLYSKLKKNNILKEPQTAVIIKQIAEALEYLHDLGIAHRDIKPENIVMSNNVSKLCDFGWATFCDERRKTYCGTFDYAAPEILEGVEYDMTVDLWCLGVLTYELMVGKAPFYHLSRKETIKKILNVESTAVTFPETMSKVAVAFIEKLLKKNPLERLTAADALKHPFLLTSELD